MKVFSTIMIFLFPICALSSSDKTWSVDIGYGAGQVEGESISATVLQLTFTPKTSLYDVMGGSIGYGFGFRTTQYQSEEFAANKNDTSEVLEDVSLTSHNLFAQIQYSRGMFQLGFNLDIIGVSSSGSFNIEGANTNIDNTTSNVFLGGAKDKGSLNSTLFIAANFDSIVIKGGLSHSVIEFEDTGLSGDDKRQRFFDTFGLTLGYRF